MPAHKITDVSYLNIYDGFAAGKIFLFTKKNTTYRYAAIQHRCTDVVDEVRHQQTSHC